MLYLRGSLLYDVSCVCLCVGSFIDVLVDHLVALSASPILAVRRLSSRAVAKLIPQCHISVFIKNIVTSLPSSNMSVVHYNQVHGQLLLVHCLLKCLLSTEVRR